MQFLANHRDRRAKDCKRGGRRSSAHPDCRLEDMGRPSACCFMETDMSFRTLALAAACSAALSACVVAPARPYYGGYGPAYGPAGEVIVTDVAPPAPYYETLPPPPFTGAVWINGYWGWHGGRHAWVGGH